jgi:hypothetical protein
VVLDGADAPAKRDAHDDRQLDVAERAGSHLGDRADDVVERRIDEPIELDLHDGPVAPQRQPDRRPHDPRLGQRRVDDPVLAEVLLQALGHPEHPAELADVLAHEDHLGVAFHRRPHAAGDPLREGGRHRVCRGPVFACHLTHVSALPRSWPGMP